MLTALNFSEGVIDAASQTRWFQVGIELVAIRYDETVGCGFLACENSCLGNKIEWGTDEERELELRNPVLITGVGC